MSKNQLAIIFSRQEERKNYADRVIPRITPIIVV